jgi:ubiquinone/menaquinone biosynthesis C-methylase UbiE
MADPGPGRPPGRRPAPSPAQPAPPDQGPSAEGSRIREGDSVVDIGAGTGLVTLGAAALAGPAGRVLALGISLPALTRCRSEARGSRPGRGPVRRRGRHAAAPSDRSFDVALARSVLIYIPDKQAAVTEMYRVLPPGRTRIDLRAHQLRCRPAPAPRRTELPARYPDISAPSTTRSPPPSRPGPGTGTR